jgi:thymidylate synthase (FAD)
MSHNHGHTYFDAGEPCSCKTEQPLVQLLEVFGSDLTVVNAARVSFSKEAKQMDEKDVKLLRYLAKHNHVSPFFHPQIRFRIKMPIFIAREWYRHQIGLARNEVSRRYVDSKVECWVPPIESLRERDPKLKQGSKANPVVGAEAVHAKIKDFTDSAIQTYESLLASGVAPEVARIVLPQSMYTEFIETGSLYAYARICNLRLDPGAQKEIRDYATQISNLLLTAFPHSWAALQGHEVKNEVVKPPIDKIYIPEHVPLNYIK